MIPAGFHELNKNKIPIITSIMPKLKLPNSVIVLLPYLFKTNIVLTVVIKETALTIRGI